MSTRDRHGSKERAAGAPTLWHQRQLVQDPLSLELNRRLVVKGRSLYPKGRRRRWLHHKPFRPFGYRLLNEALGRHTVCFNTQIGRAGKRGGLGKRLVTRSKSTARPKRARRVIVIFPPRSGFVQVEVFEIRSHRCPLGNSRHGQPPETLSQCKEH